MKRRLRAWTPTLLATSTLLAVLVATPPHLHAQAMPGVDSLLQRDVDLEHVAGAVVQVKQGDEILHRAAYGFAQRYAFGMRPLDPPDSMRTEHLFDLASLTKVFGTTFAVMVLVDRGLVDLNAPVRTYLPEFSGAGKDSVTVRHLLTHTGGLAPWEPVYYHVSVRGSSPGETLSGNEPAGEAPAASEVYRYVARHPLAYPVGEARHYSDLGFMLLGYLVEHVTGVGLGRFLREQVYAPLGLAHTTYAPLEHGFRASQIAATSHGNPFERRMVYDDDFGYVCDEDPESWDGWRQVTLRGEVNDGNAHYAHGGAAGHAGLFSTVDDVQVLVDLLLDDGRGLVSRSVVREFLTPDATGNGLGWAMSPASIPAGGAPERTFGHTGFTGTSIVAIPEHDLSIILLTNRQNVGPENSGYYYDLNPTRQRLVDYVLEYVASRGRTGE